MYGETTAMLTEAVVEPPVLVAVMVQLAAAMRVVGVPLMTPVGVYSVSPAGRAGETEYETTAPPLLVGLLSVIAEPVVYVAGLLE